MGTAVEPAPTAKSQRVSARHPLLEGGGYFSMAFAVFQISAIWWPASVIRWFGGPAKLSVERPIAYAGLCIGATVIAAIFGVYALSGAGRIRRLPLLPTGLIVVTAIYLLRGLIAVPQLPMALIHPEFARYLVFSLIALVVGGVHAAGVVQFCGTVSATHSGLPDARTQANSRLASSS